jgi:hypothetical protein
MSKARTVARVLVGSAVVAAACVAMASPASAQPRVNGFSCVSTGQQRQCTVHHTGTVTPFTIRWTVDGVPVPRSDDSPVLRFRCIPSPFPTFTLIGVTVADPTGADSVDFGLACVPFL